MRICVFGAGAIGGLLAARLADSGAEVSVVARGAHLEAIRQNGLTLLSADGEGRERPLVVTIEASDRASELGPQDAVIVAVKGQGIAGATAAIQPVLGPETAVVTAQNGVPWWYFHGVGGELEGAHLESIDPGGEIWRAIGPRRAIGCVVYPAGEIVQPGVVRHIDGRRFMIGEPDGSISSRVTALGQLLSQAGFRAPVRRRLRDDIWLKLWGNLAFNPLSVVSGATLGEIGADPHLRGRASRLMEEGRDVAEALGIRLRVDLAKRLQWAVDVGDHRTSMLQDFEAGRPLELAGVVAAVADIGSRVGVATPTIDAVLAEVRSLVERRDRESS